MSVEFLQVYDNHAFIVSEASNHGMQVFDLTQLRDLKPATSPLVLTETAHYGEMNNTHNIVGNEDTGYMYAVGTSTCRSGLHMINVRDPTNPQFAGCFGDDGYVHDAQCVVYSGPDAQFKGREICFCYNEDTLTVVDVEDKDKVVLLSRVPYNNAYYTHQGWLNEGQTHLLLNDELDELYGPRPNTRSMIWNVKSLASPELIGSFYSEEQATDHNLYIRCVGRERGRGGGEGGEGREGGRGRKGGGGGREGVEGGRRERGSEGGREGGVDGGREGGGSVCDYNVCEQTLSISPQGWTGL